MEPSQQKGKRPNFAHMKNKKKRKGKNHNIKLSKKLSFILRHGALKLGIDMADDGYVKVDDLFTKGKVKATLKQIQEVVENNDKKRFQLKEESAGKWKIRAVQGHTLTKVDQEKLLTRIQNPAYFKDMTIVHGTYITAWKEIRYGGLNKMARNHMHFAKGYNFQGDSSTKNADVISGMRNTCEIFIEIDPVLAMKEGIVFFVSNNGVILTEGYWGNLPICFFKDVYVRGDKLNIYKKEVGTKLFDLNTSKGDPYKEGLDLVSNGNDRVLVMKNRRGIPFVKYFSRKYFFVLDFEANCVENGKLSPQEIIEFPVVPVEAITGDILSKKIFHTYVKPEHHEITGFCTELTGISKETVEKGVSISKALEMFEEYLKENNFDDEDFVIVTCGDWDLRTCLKKEAKFKKLYLPPYLRRFINIKDLFRCILRGPGKIGMKGMLEYLGIELEGRHHSGIDDSKNIAKILSKIIQSGAFINRAYEKEI